MAKGPIQAPKKSELKSVREQHASLDQRKKELVERLKEDCKLLVENAEAVARASGRIIGTANRTWHDKTNMIRVVKDVPADEMMGRPANKLQIYYKSSPVYSEANKQFSYGDWVDALHAETDAVREQQEQKEITDLRGKIAKLREELGDAAKDL